MTKKGNFVPAAVRKTTHESVLEMDAQQDASFEKPVFTHADLFDAGIELLRREFDKSVYAEGGTYGDTVAACEKIQGLVAAAKVRQMRRLCREVGVE